MGQVPQKSYEYFEQHDISIEAFAHDWDEELAVPEEFWPFEPGSWHDCDDLLHETGVELHEDSRITVYDEANEVVWSSSLDLDTLDSHSVILTEAREVYSSDQPIGTCVYIGQSSEKGLFFDGQVEIDGDFDPAKLSLTYDDCEGQCLVTAVSYADQEVYSENMDTVSKGLYHTLTRIE